MSTVTELVWCENPNHPGGKRSERTSKRTAHHLTPECMDPCYSGHYSDRSSVQATHPSMTTVETLDPREAR